MKEYINKNHHVYKSVYDAAFKMYCSSRAMEDREKGANMYAQIPEKCYKIALDESMVILKKHKVISDTMALLMRL